MEPLNIIEALDMVDEPAFYYVEGHVDLERFVKEALALGCSVNTVFTFGNEPDVVQGAHVYLKRIKCEGERFMYDVRTDLADGFRPVTVISA